MVGIYKLDLITMFLNSLLYISLLEKIQVVMTFYFNVYSGMS